MAKMQMAPGVLRKNHIPCDNDVLRRIVDARKAEAEGIFVVIHDAAVHQRADDARHPLHGHTPQDGHQLCPAHQRQRFVGNGGGHRRFGIADADFALLDGREKMITKMPIRLLTLQALDLSSRRVFWDVGFCTGSVSIEARRLFPHLRIVAFEIRPECEAIIEENARRLGAPGIEVRMGEPDEVWDALNQDNKISLYCNVGGSVTIFNKNLGD